MTHAIRATALHKTYGKGESAFTALKGVDLTVEKGESVAIVGKSGSGKSTLMHLLALMDTPDTGELEIMGKGSRTLSKKELDGIRNKEFGFVFQQYFLDGRSTVLENVILPLKIAGVGRKERNDAGLKALEAVDLLSKAKNKANDLSGGQKQRVVIARALINNANLIFADEPSGALDSNTGAMIEDLLFTLNKERGVTLVIVTHDLDLAAKCDRQLHMKDGLLTEGDVA